MTDNPLSSGRASRLRAAAAARRPRLRRPAPRPSELLPAAASSASRAPSRRGTFRGRASPSCDELKGKRPFFLGARPVRPGRRRPRRRADLRQARRGRQGGHRADERPARGAEVRRRATSDRLRDAYRRRTSTTSTSGSAQADGRVPRRHLRLRARRHRHRASASTATPGAARRTSHRLSTRSRYLIRHPRGEKAGDDIDWYASTHDVAADAPVGDLGLDDPRQDAPART